MLDTQEKLVWTVPNVLSDAECDALIARIESAGPESAPITTSSGFQHRPEIRNNGRVMFDDPALAGTLYERVFSTLPAQLGGWIPVGANERMRCYRYLPGQYFKPHFDGAFTRSPTESSLLTLMVYLNEGYEGGSTRFLDLERMVIPRRGMALLFQHMLLHEGCTVRSGVKYAIRSDVMYRRADPRGAA